MLPRTLLLLAGAILVSGSSSTESPHSSLDTLLADSIDSCLGSNKSTEECLRVRLSDYLGAPRSSDGRSLLARVRQLMATNDVRIQLPEYLQSAELVFRPNKGIDFDVEFPKEDENEVTPRSGRDMMKQKMLFPLLMLVKLKLKALTPIMLAFVGLKATKALILSKIAIVLVVGFLIVQLCQKLGMAKMSMQAAMPAAMSPMDPTPPPSMYGPPTTATSYDPNSWEPAPGPYARVYDTAQQMAYSSYTPQPTAQTANKYKV